MKGRPYRFTHRAKIIAIVYGGLFDGLSFYLATLCMCPFKLMFQTHGLFWMVYVLVGLFLLLYILKTAEKVEGKDDGETAV